MSASATLLDPQLAALAEGGLNFITETTRTASGSMAEFYEENGYLVVPDALSTEELQELRNEALRICKGEVGEVGGFDAVVASAPASHFDYFGGIPIWLMIAYAATGISILVDPGFYQRIFASGNYRQARNAMLIISGCTAFTQATC